MRSVAILGEVSVLVALAACAGCSNDPERCGPEPDPAEAREPCAVAAPDEWASAPDDATVLVPVRLAPWPDGRAADAVVLVGRPGDGSFVPRRLTFRVGLTDGSLTLFGTEPLGQAWFEARVEQARAAPPELRVACLPLPDGGELRLAPSRPGVGPPPEGEFYGLPFGRALRRLDATGAEALAFDLWAPHPWTSESDDADRVRCGTRLVIFQPGGERRLRCTPFRGGGACPGLCLTNDDAERPWQCTGQAPDGLLYCEPQP